MAFFSIIPAKAKEGAAMPEIYQTLLRDLSEFGLHLLYAIAVVAVGFKLIGPLSRWFGRLKLMRCV